MRSFNWYCRYVSETILTTRLQLGWWVHSPYATVHAHQLPIDLKVEFIDDQFPKRVEIGIEIAGVTVKSGKMDTKDDVLWKIYR